MINWSWKIFESDLFLLENFPFEVAKLKKNFIFVGNFQIFAPRKMSISVRY